MFLDLLAPSTVQCKQVGSQQMAVDDDKLLNHVNEELLNDSRVWE